MKIKFVLLIFAFICIGNARCDFERFRTDFGEIDYVNGNLENEMDDPLISHYNHENRYRNDFLDRMIFSKNQVSLYKFLDRAKSFVKDHKQVNFGKRIFAHIKYRFHTQYKEIGFQKRSFFKTLIFRLKNNFTNK